MTKRKRSGTKVRIRDEKEKERRVAVATFLTLILSIVAFSAYFGYTILGPSSDLSLTGPTQQSNPENSTSKLKAAIVDEVSFITPNQTFVQAATDILEHANYSVDYYSGEKVTVDFFRNLPTHGYSMIILRVHSGIDGTQPPVSLATSEASSAKKYIYEQLADQIHTVRLTSGPRTPYFAICPSFVKSSMKGRFKNTIIIMMGCDGLTYTDMAEAFGEKGAEAYISWKGGVSLSYSDQATIRLLQHLVTERQTIIRAGEKTVEDVGRDPTHTNTTLGYYPLASGNYAIQR